MNIFKRIGKIVGKAAPLLGTVVSGGSLDAIGIVAKVCGLAPDSPPAEIEKALQADPSLLVKMKEAEFEHEQKLMELGVERYDIAAKASIEYSKSKNVAYAYMIPGVVFFNFVGLLFCLYAITFIPVPEPNKLLFGSVVGLVGAGWNSIMHFLFGSSQGSKEKDGKIDRMIGP